MKYIGTKIIDAIPMDIVDAEKYLHRAIQHSGVPDREPGYLVRYADGYESWSPVKAFEDAYRPTTGMTFGYAIEALKKGLMVARKGWNGNNMFIFMRPADELNVEFVVDKVKSLPQSVKNYYLQDITDEKGERIPVEEDDNVKFTAYLCLKAADGTVVNGWLASQTDILSEDWVVVE